MVPLCTLTHKVGPQNKPVCNLGNEKPGLVWCWCPDPGLATGKLASGQLPSDGDRAIDDSLVGDVAALVDGELPLEDGDLRVDFGGPELGILQLLPPIIVLYFLQQHVWDDSPY